MAKAIPIERFSAELKEILDEYGDEVQVGVSEAVQTVTKASAKAVRANSRTMFKQHTKLYAQSWRYQIDESGRGAVGTVYSKHYSLPHLLENGHAKRGGGRTPVMGRAHIEPVEQEAIRQVEQAIIKAVT